MKIFVLLAAAASLLGAQDRPTVRAHGEATVTASPDQLTVQIGVVTQAQTAQAAGAANAKQAAEVIAQLKKSAGAGAEIKTVSYSVHPNYRYAKEGGNPTISGYTATNIVQVTSGDISSAGSIIDTATKSGANTVQGVQFTLKDEQAARTRALKEAIQQARASAEAMASAAGLRILRILRIEDTAQPDGPRPVREMMMASRAADAPPTPVEPGVIQVRASVSVVVEVGP